MTAVAAKPATDREAKHMEKVLGVIRARLADALRSRYTGKLVIELSLRQGGVRETYTEIGMTYRILEETAPSNGALS